jgi:ankyrin repeat protein
MTSSTSSYKRDRVAEQDPPAGTWCVDEGDAKRRRVDQLNSLSYDLSLDIDDEGSNFPDPCEASVSPDAFYLKLVKAQCGIELQCKSALDLADFFSQVTEDQMAAYSTDVVTATRNNDIATLRELSAQGKALDCFNRFGESLLHLACRRGCTEIVEFLLEQPGVCLRIVDDCGRTPLHDACWNATPQLDICKRILEQEPALFLITDKRGYTPFQYARDQHWHIWRQFLFDNRESLAALGEPETMVRFSS